MSGSSDPERSWEARVSCSTLLIVAFTQHLSMMLKNGVSITQALQALREQPENPNFELAVEEINESICQGGKLSAALARFPRLFPGVYANVVRVGESTGSLTDCLDLLAEWLEIEERTARRVLSAMSYPALVLGVALLLMLLLFCTVIPQFMLMLEGMNMQLPWITRVVMFITHLVQNPGIWLLVLVSAGAARLWLKHTWARPAGRRRLFSLLLKLPGLGRILWYASLCRFAATSKMGIMTGLDLVQTLQLAAEASGSPILEHDNVYLTEALSNGQQVSDYLRQRPQIYHSTLVHLFFAGEEAADIGPALDRAAHYYQQEVDHLVSNLGKVLEPILLLAVAVLVGLLLIAIFLPLYSYLAELKV